VKPVLQALVVADRIYQDRATGKIIICGTFNKLFFSKQPPAVQAPNEAGVQQTVVTGGMDAGSPWAYISLTDVAGQVELLLQFTNLSKNQSIFSTKLQAKAQDRLQTVEIVAPLPKLPIREPGTYALEVLCEGEILGAHRVTAQEFNIQKPRNEADSDS
jgi:hypothetical protein